MISFLQIFDINFNLALKTHLKRMCMGRSVRFVYGSIRARGFQDPTLLRGLHSL